MCLPIDPKQREMSGFTIQFLVTSRRIHLYPSKSEYISNVSSEHVYNRQKPADQNVLQTLTCEDEKSEFKKSLSSKIIHGSLRNDPINYC